jgi:hypothetical protein
MGSFLDLRSSMNSNITGAPGTSLTTTPVLFGTIGLQTRNVISPIVTLSGIVGVSSPVTGTNATVEIQIVRGTTGGTTIFIATNETIGGIINEGVQTISFTAQDLLAPAAAETVYSAFVRGSTAVVISGSLRFGPEVFWGIASSTV